MTVVFGIDASTTRTGLARPDGTTISITSMHGPDAADRRLDEISSRVERELRLWPAADLVVMEKVLLHGPGAKSLLRLAELTGAIKRDAFRLGLDVIEVPGSSLKLAATGNGKASKDDMFHAATDAGASPRNHDEADAWHLHDVGRRALAGLELPPSVAALPWPTRPEGSIR